MCQDRLSRCLLPQLARVALHTPFEPLPLLRIILGPVSPQIYAGSSAVMTIH